jgi:hypothetical protein
VNYPEYTRRQEVLTFVDYRAVSGVFQNMDPPPPSPPSECVLPPHQRGGGGGGGSHSPGGERGGGSIIWKTSAVHITGY